MRGKLVRDKLINKLILIVAFNILVSLFLCEACFGKGNRLADELGYLYSTVVSLLVRVIAV